MAAANFPDQVELALTVDDPEDEGSLRVKVAEQLGVVEAELPALRLIKRSLDARRGKVRFRLLLSLDAGQEEPLSEHEFPRECSPGSRVVVIGDGPAGLFCAYQLARQGIGCTVVDRGKPVQARRRDLKLLNARGGVDSDSNYCFGEGGAGTYSDGKLYTRSHKRGPVRDILEILHAHGAPAAILTEARPHIGSNLLPKVISSLRERLEAVGVIFRFGSRFEGLVQEGSGAGRRVSGVVLRDVESGEKETLEASNVVVAAGHSARDVYRMAQGWGIALEPKGFALGVRIEHPQALINEIQLGHLASHPKLGAASYKLATQVEERGVFSFCMCPGGWIVPAMTDPSHLVVNGMSLSKRDSPFANSGLVVGVEVEDIEKAGLKGDLGGIELQERLERAACVAGGGDNRAPAVRATDFLEGRESSTLPESSYLPGLSAASVGSVLDEVGLGLSMKIREALRSFNQRMRGYLSEEAVLVGVESRTSAPVRVLRDKESLETPGLKGLYPCGEGPGYAGGIVSAAVDGLRVAERISRRASI